MRFSLLYNVISLRHKNAFSLGKPQQETKAEGGKAWPTLKCSWAQQRHFGVGLSGSTILALLLSCLYDSEPGA
jgi:hypothetical protein